MGPAAGHRDTHPPTNAIRKAVLTVHDSLTPGSSKSSTGTSLNGLVTAWNYRDRRTSGKQPIYKLNLSDAGYSRSNVDTRTRTKGEHRNKTEETGRR